MYDTYIDAWTDITNMHMGMTGYEQLIVDLNWLYRFAPRRLMKIFNSGYDEADPKFIVPSKNSPYVYIDYEVRHNRAVNFWHAQRVKEENRRNSNNGNKK